MNKHSKKVVWLAAALPALSATAADAGQRQGAQARRGPGKADGDG